MKTRQNKTKEQAEKKTSRKKQKLKIKQYYRLIRGMLL